MTYDGDGKLRIINRFQEHVSVEWKIDGNLIINDLCTSNEINFCSSLFSHCDAEWSLFINNFDDESWISLGLEKDSDRKIHHINYTLEIKNRDGSVYKSLDCMHRYLDKDDAEWSAEFMKSSHLKHFLAAEDTLNIFCNLCVKGSIKETACQTESSKGAGTLIENFKDLYLSERQCDVTINVKDQEFKAHRLILGARSPVFASMFEHSTAEKQSGVVDITDCDPNSFKDFLLFLYTGKVNEISSEHVFGLYKTADKYDLKELKEECIQFMIRDLSLATFCDAVLLAALHNEQELLTTTTDFFTNNVKLILPTKEWQILISDNPTLANELFIKVVNNG